MSGGDRDKIGVSVMPDHANMHESPIPTGTTASEASNRAARRKGSWPLTALQNAAVSCPTHRPNLKILAHLAATVSANVDDQASPGCVCLRAARRGNTGRLPHHSTSTNMTIVVLQAFMAGHELTQEASQRHRRAEFTEAVARITENSRSRIPARKFMPHFPAAANSLPHAACCVSCVLQPAAR